MVSSALQAELAYGLPEITGFGKPGCARPCRLRALRPGIGVFFGGFETEVWYEILKQTAQQIDQERQDADPTNGSQDSAQHLNHFHAPWPHRSGARLRRG
ncbi:MAG: hypothetical protein IPK16_07170 [Anaerolineales bacterium]|nr:hypothetical protein [Anaerolineales bacterium]